MKDLPEGVEAIASIAARQVANRFHGYVERADLQQEMLMWCLEHPKKVSKWLDPDDAGERKRGEGALRVTLRRVGEQYARTERAEAAGFSTDDEYFYDIAVVEELLPEAFNPDGWPPVVVKDDSGKRTKRPLNEGNDRLSKIADVQAALRKIPEGDVWALEQHYSLGRTYVEIARDLDVSKSKVHRDCERALGWLSEHLGGRSPWDTKERVYRRSVVSNAQAQAALEV